MIKKTLLITLTYCFFIQHLSATLVKGDVDTSTGNTFSFTIGHAKLAKTESEQSRLWLAAGTVPMGDAQKYGLSFVQQISEEPFANSQTGVIITPGATAMANEGNATIYQYDTAAKEVKQTSAGNPIYGSQFNLFDMCGNKPVFTVGATPNNNLYYVHNIERYEVPEEGKTNTTELLLYDLGATEQAVALHCSQDNVFVAHATGGAFSQARTSTITKLTQNTNLQTTGGSLPYLEKLADITVDTSTSALVGGGPNLDSFGPNITFHSFNGKTYAGLAAKSGNTGGEKAAGIMIVTTTMPTPTTLGLQLDKIADDAVISATTATAVSAPQNTEIRVTHLAGMATSTSLNYLIVAQNNLDAATMANQPRAIYAVPLVSSGENIGRVADISVGVSNEFFSSPNRFNKRSLTTLLTDPTQITPTNATYKEQLTVGQGGLPLSAGDIQNMYVVGDTVYAVIGTAYTGAAPNTTQPGTFYSQAIFDEEGKIISWTPWARALGSDNPMLFSSVDDKSTVNFTVSDATGGTNYQSVMQSQWNTNHNLSTLFKAPQIDKGGTQGIFDFPQNSSLGTGLNNVSFLITTEFNKVTVGQTGETVSGDFKVAKITETEIQKFPNETLTTINDQGAIIAAELAHNGANHWLFVGGAQGVSVLTDDINGYTHTGNFTGITDFTPTGKSWKKIGEYTFVKKLVWDNTTYLYILTPRQLDRILLDPDKFKATPTTELNITTVLQSSDLFGNPYLTDVVIDENFCIVGTTNGMYTLDTITKNISPVIIPDGLPTASQLFIVSNNKEPQRKFKDKSNLYVLNNTFGTQQARINRFAINNENITPFDDSLLGASTTEGIPSSFITFNNYISHYYTNGSMNLASTYFLGATQPTLTFANILQIYAGVKNGKSSTHVIIPMLSRYVSTFFLSNTDNFLGISRESTSGALVAAGNLEARVNA